MSARLTILDQLYYRSRCDAQPTEFRCGFTVTLSSEEQPYVRERVSVGSNWGSVDFGWLTGKVGFAILENVGKVTLGLSGQHGTIFTEIFPGESQRLRIVTPLLICASSESVGQYTVRAFPK